VRIPVDECMVGAIVRRLREEGHDVLWMREAAPSTADEEVLRHSWRESRILLTQDRGFGELAVRLKRPARGILVVSSDLLVGDLNELAANVARLIARLGDRLEGTLTIMEAGRTRQRDLVSPEARDVD
jgi:predicted nuclease of predicted toxin-antitoxin system